MSDYKTPIIVQFSRQMVVKLYPHKELTIMKRNV